MLARGSGCLHGPVDRHLNLAAVAKARTAAHWEKSPDLAIFSAGWGRQTIRCASSSFGSRPSGVSWSTKRGRCWLSPESKSSRPIPVCFDNVSSVSVPSALASSPSEICLFGPVPIHECATSPWPLCWNCLSRPPRPPLSTVPAAAPPRTPPSVPRSRSPSPPPLLPPPGRPALTSPGRPAGWLGAESGAAHVLHRVDREQSQQRLGH